MKPPCKSIASAGGVEHFGQGQGRGEKQVVALKQQRAVFAFFDDQIPRPHLRGWRRRLSPKSARPKVAGFLVVDGEHIYFFRMTSQESSMAVFIQKFIVSRAMSFGAFGQLFHDAHLHGRREVAQHEVLGDCR
jgi:hypothetical protein